MTKTKAKKAKAKKPPQTIKIQVVVSVPRAGEFLMEVPIDLDLIRPRSHHDGDKTMRAWVQEDAEDYIRHHLKVKPLKSDVDRALKATKARMEAEK